MKNRLHDFPKAHPTPTRHPTAPLRDTVAVPSSAGVSLQQSHPALAAQLRGSFVSKWVSPALGTPSIISVLIFNVQTNPVAATTSARPAPSSVVGRAPALGAVGLAVGMLSALQHTLLLCPRNSPTIPSPWGLRYRDTQHSSCLSQAELLIALVPHPSVASSKATVPRDPKTRCERVEGLRVVFRAG